VLRVLAGPAMASCARFYNFGESIFIINLSYVYVPMQGAARGLKLTRVTPIRYNMTQRVESGEYTYGRRVKA